MVADQVPFPAIDFLPLSRCRDKGKLINGRKRHVVVDTLGLLLGVMVTSADIGDRAAAQALLERVAHAHHRLELVWADGGYTGSLVGDCLAALALVMAIVQAQRRHTRIRGAAQAVAVLADRIRLCSAIASSARMRSASSRRPSTRRRAASSCCSSSPTTDGMRDLLGSEEQDAFAGLAPQQ